MGGANASFASPWYINGAPPGWRWCMQQGCHAGVASGAQQKSSLPSRSQPSPSTHLLLNSDAGRLEFSRTWRFNSTSTNVSGNLSNALGLPIYVLPVAPFNASHGELYTAEVLFQAHEVFQGVPGSKGGGGGGACQGSASFWYGGNRSRPFFGDGGGGGNGGQAGERLRWEFSVHGRHVFEAGLQADEPRFSPAPDPDADPRILTLTPNLQAEEAGLSSASYEAPSTRQCGMGLCAMASRATGMCEAVCGNESAAELTALSWQPSGQSDQSQLASTLCM